MGFVICVVMAWRGRSSGLATSGTQLSAEPHEAMAGVGLLAELGTENVFPAAAVAVAWARELARG